MQFLFLCHSLNIGGIETYILRFANWLRHKHPDHELHVICKSGIFGPYETDFIKADVVLHSMPMGYINPLQYFQFYRFLVCSHFDAVCDFSGDFGAIPLVCASGAKVPRRFVFYRNARNPYVHTKYKRVYQSFLNRIVRIFSTKILSNSQNAFDYYYPSYPVIKDSSFKIIRNGIPTASVLSFNNKTAIRESLGISPNKKMVLHVGSGRWEKNHKFILMIAKIAQDRGDNICFYFAGPDVEQNHGKFTSFLELKNINFLGERRDVQNLMQTADVFLFPSLSEGQPNALLEAITNGLPFIASNIAPIRESLSPAWGDRWLFSPDKLDQGYSLLQEHVKNDFRQDQKFKKLIEWCDTNYNEDKRFGEFLTHLSL